MESQEWLFYPDDVNDRRDIDHVDLRLDQKNPRHEPVKSQRAAVAALLADPIDRDKVINLAKHMGSHGPSPIDSIAVVEEGGAFVVVEGNRRTAALKLLHNPSLTDDQTLAKRFRQIARSVDVLPSSLNAVVMGSREDAREWQILRHGGEGKGAGVVPWSTEAAQRFHRRPGSQSDRALTVLDAVEAAYTDLKDVVERIKKNKLTTFGRLVSDPYFRDQLGLQIEQDNLHRHYPATSLKPAIESILKDLDTTLTVSKIKTKEQRRQYIESKRGVLPSAAEYSATPEPFGSQKTKKGTKGKGAKPKPKPRLFGNLALVNAPDRVQDLVTEVRKLDPTTYPNATAVLIRGVVELMVDEVFGVKQWSPKRYLKDRIQDCLRELDPKNKDNKYQPVRAGLTDSNHLMSARTLNAWVHNVHFSPAPSDLETIAKNWTPFVQGLDGLL